MAAIQQDLAIRDGAMPEVALRFCLSHPAVSSVIPGMRSRANVEFNCSIPGKGPLPEKVLAILKRHAWERNFYDEWPRWFFGALWTGRSLGTAVACAIVPAPTSRRCPCLPRS